MMKHVPAAAGKLAQEYPAVWEAYAALGRATAETGPLTERERRRVKLALAVGAGSEGAVHSHTRRARSEGIEDQALRQVALLAIGPLGLPRAMAARTWIDDLGD